MCSHIHLYFIVLNKVDPSFDHTVFQTLGGHKGAALTLQLLVIVMGSMTVMMDALGCNQYVHTIASVPEEEHHSIVIWFGYVVCSHHQHIGGI